MSANRSSSSSTSLKANVLKLSEPAKDLLPGVDVFIFDCDGVIWRVSNIVKIYILHNILVVLILSIIANTQHTIGRLSY